MAFSLQQQLKYLQGELTNDQNNVKSLTGQLNLFKNDPQGGKQMEGYIQTIKNAEGIVEGDISADQSKINAENAPKPAPQPEPQPQQPSKPTEIINNVPANPPANVVVNPKTDVINPKPEVVDTNSDDVAAEKEGVNSYKDGFANGHKDGMADQGHIDNDITNPNSTYNVGAKAQEAKDADRNDAESVAGQNYSAGEKDGSAQQQVADTKTDAKHDTGSVADNNYDAGQAAEANADDTSSKQWHDAQAAQEKIDNDPNNPNSAFAKGMVAEAQVPGLQKENELLHSIENDISKGQTSNVNGANKTASEFGGSAIASNSAPVSSNISDGDFSHIVGLDSSAEEHLASMLTSSSAVAGLSNAPTATQAASQTAEHDTQGSHSQHSLQHGASASGLGQQASASQGAVVGGHNDDAQTASDNVLSKNPEVLANENATLASNIGQAGAELKSVNNNLENSISQSMKTIGLTQDDLNAQMGGQANVENGQSDAAKSFEAGLAKSTDFGSNASNVSSEISNYETQLNEHNLLQNEAATLGKDEQTIGNLQQTVNSDAGKLQTMLNADTQLPSAERQSLTHDFQKAEADVNHKSLTDSDSNVHSGSHSATPQQATPHSHSGQAVTQSHLSSVQHSTSPHQIGDAKTGQASIHGKVGDGKIGDNTGSSEESHESSYQKTLEADDKMLQNDMKTVSSHHDSNSASAAQAGGAVVSGAGAAVASGSSGENQEAQTLSSDISKFEKDMSNSKMPADKTAVDSYANSVLSSIKSEPESSVTDDQKQEVHLAEHDMDEDEAHLCFGAGTLIETAQGKVAIEKLVPGDLVKTLKGEYKPVVRLVCQNHKIPANVTNYRNVPVKIKAGAISEGVPSRDVVVSPAHGLHFEASVASPLFGEHKKEILLRAGDLVNHKTVHYMDVPEIDYYHVELPEHEILFAEDMPAETFQDFGELKGHVTMNSSSPKDICPRLRSGPFVSSIKENVIKRAA